MRSRSCLRVASCWLAALLSASIAHAANNSDEELGGIGGTGRTTGAGDDTGGIGGTGHNQGGEDIGGIGGTGIRGFGHIQGFGSIFVNNREYFINDHTRIVVDGKPAKEQALNLGGIVRVEASGDPASTTAQALRITSEHQLVGRIEAIDREHNRISLLGQQVLIGTTTRLGEAIDLKTLQPGDSIAINGLPHQPGQWAATLIERHQGDNFIVRGHLGTIHPTSHELSLGERRFQLASPAELRSGEWTTLYGQYQQQTLVVHEVQGALAQHGAPGERLEIEGHLVREPQGTRFITEGLSLATSLTPIDVQRETERAVLIGHVDLHGQIVIEQLRLEIERPDIEAVRDRATPARERIDIERHQHERQEIEHHRFERPELEHLEIERIEIERPEVERPEIQPIEIERPEIEPIEH